MNLIIFNIKLYFDSLKEALVLTFKNIFSYLLFTLYIIIICFGTYFLEQKNYILSIFFLIVSLFCISSMLYITKQITSKGYFNFKDLLVSYKIYFFRANFVFAFWYAVFYFINRLIITPISSILSDYVYLIFFPIILLVFLIFNTLPEEVYYSDISLDSIFINSINFIEKHWAVWSIPNIFILFIINLLDYRISILPTYSLIHYSNFLIILQTIPFYIKILIITIALIFRGVLFTKLIQLKEPKVN